MKILDININTPALAVVPVGDRYSRLFLDTVIEVTTGEGVYKFMFNHGFMTNFRSGGVLVDLFIDQIGDEKKALWYLVHDAIYTPCAALGMEHPLARKTGDELLKAGLIFSGMSKFEAGLVYRSVRMFGHSAYWKDDEHTQSNSRLFNFEWCDKNAHAQSVSSGR